jgi:hypothetical protein
MFVHYDYDNSFSMRYVLVIKLYLGVSSWVILLDVCQRSVNGWIIKHLYGISDRPICSSFQSQLSQYQQYLPLSE